MARSHHHFLFPVVLTVRLMPSGDARLDGWSFVLADGPGGWTNGSLLMAARGMLRLAQDRGFPAIDLVIPRAGLWGVFPHRVRLVAPGDERQLIGVDVEALRRRHGAARERRGWRAALAACVARLRLSLPAGWPAVP